MFENKYTEDNLTNMYEELNTWAINDIIYRIMKNEVITETSKYLIYRLQEAGIHLKELKRRIKRLTGLSNKEINRIFKKASIDENVFINSVFINNKKLYVSDQMKYVLNYYSNATKNEFINLNTRIEKSSYNILIREMDKVHYSVVTGFKSQDQAILETIDDLSQKGIPVKNLSGNNESIESAVRRYIHTGVNKCIGDINLTKTKELGLNHVLVSSHLGARHVENANPKYLSHDLWQGKVYRIN